MQTGIEKINAKRIETNLRKIDASPAVDRFLSGYAKPNTRRIYSYQLARYLEWLEKSKNVSMMPINWLSEVLHGLLASSLREVQWDS